MKHKAEITGAALGGVAFMAGVGIAKIITAPFRACSPKNELEASHVRVAHHVHIQQEYQEVHIRTQPRIEPTTIDMGTVEEYDPYEVNNLVTAQRQWDQNQEQIRKQQNFNNFCRQNQERQWEQQGGSPAQFLQEAMAKAERKEKARKEKGIIASWFTK